MRAILLPLAAILLGLAVAKLLGPALAWWNHRAVPVSVALPAGSERVVVLTRSTCPHCTRLKAWLDERGIAFTEYEVDAGIGSELMSQLGEIAVPVTIAGGRRVLGFQPDRIEEVLVEAGIGVAATGQH